MRWDERGSASIPVSEMSEEEQLRLALDILYDEANKNVNDTVWKAWIVILKDKPGKLGELVDFLRVGTGR